MTLMMRPRAPAAGLAAEADIRCQCFAPGQAGREPWGRFGRSRLQGHRRNAYEATGTALAVAWLGGTSLAWSGDEGPATEVTLDLKTQVSGRIGFGGPIGASATLRLLRGLGADVREGSGRVKGVCALPVPHCANGFLLELAGGSGGGKLSLGLGARARVEEKGFRGTVGFGLKASLARTWGSPVGTEPRLTYLGPELDLSVMRVELTLGVLTRVSGAGGRSVLFSWGLGIGL